MEPRLQPLFERRLAGQVGVRQFEQEARGYGVTRAQLYPQYGEFQRTQRPQAPTPEAVAPSLETDQRKKLMSLLPGANLERLQTRALAERAAARIEMREQAPMRGEKMAACVFQYDADPSRNLIVDFTCMVRVTFSMELPTESTFNHEVKRAVTAHIKQLTEANRGSFHRSPQGYEAIADETFNEVMDIIDHAEGLGMDVFDTELTPYYNVSVKGIRYIQTTPELVNVDME